MTTENTSLVNQKSGKWKNVIEETIAATGSKFYLCDPNLKTSVMVFKEGSDVAIKGSNSDVDPIDNSKHVALGAAGVSSVDDFIGTDSQGLTSIEIATTTYNGTPFTVSIKQFIPNAN